MTTYTTGPAADTATIHTLPTAGRGLSPMEHMAIRTALPKATDAQLIDSLDIIARELDRRGLGCILADTMREIEFEKQSEPVLAATAASLDAAHQLGGVA